ncbi:MAG: ABC transporter ATP-binding protein [Caldilineaceae bacterium]|nr:ABC transporter ATP-binding protein [Caldilineaceae bacterium]
MVQNANEQAHGQRPTTAAAPPVIAIEAMTKVYRMGETEVHALNGVSLTIAEGEYVAIIGTSGSGKSTLMNMIGLLDKPTAGSYRIRGTETSALTQNRMADMRNREIGFVFQRFNLLARTNARRQVELPLFYAGVSARQASQMAIAALERVGLADRTHHRPDELSGGQQQRVAIARALVNRPSILLADEPTGALDTKTGEEVMGLFEELHQQGMTLIVVTHDQEVAQQAQRIITLRDGKIISDIPNTQWRQNGKSAPETQDETPLADGPVGEMVAMPSVAMHSAHSDGLLLAK